MEQRAYAFKIARPATSRPAIQCFSTYLGKAAEQVGRKHGDT